MSQQNILNLEFQFTYGKDGETIASGSIMARDKIFSARHENWFFSEFVNIWDYFGWKQFLLFVNEFKKMINKWIIMIIRQNNQR